MDLRTRWALVRFGITFLSLFAGWLLFTWSLDSGSLLAGGVSSLAVSLVTYPIFVEETEAGRRAHLPRPHMFLLFLAALVFSMYVASFRVLWRILRGDINPRVVHFRTRLKTDIARVVLTSSITLTPGTITLDLDDDHLVVHWLDAQTTHSRYAGMLIKGAYEKLLRGVWL
ncbi:Na+/H+ antiporter subunit E [Candidatus Fermentibacterales bacterium]|nr:Na+/H+ antiporter subunit E [Candidatus Fermentibacterales bacterium]